MSFLSNAAKGVSGAVNAGSGGISLEAKLPFPINPGEFWAEALKTIYGPGHVLLGLGQSNITHPDGSPMNVGPLMCGLIFTVGGGVSNQGGSLPSVQVKLALLDLKMLNWDGGICMELDQSRPGEDCALVTLNPQKIFDKFVEFANPLNWPKLAQEFASNPVKFFEKNIEVFYPAGININFNVKGTIGTMGQGIAGIVGGHRLINRDPIWVCCANTPSFPPKNFGLTPRDPIVLFNKENPEEAVAIVQKVETIWMHPAYDLPSEGVVCQPIVASTLSFDLLRDLVYQYLNPPKWP